MTNKIKAEWSVDIEEEKEKANIAKKERLANQLKQKEWELERLAKTAKGWGFLELEGTERQVMWANQIRDDFLNRQEDEIDEVCFECLMSDPTAQTAQFWIEYGKKGDDKIFDFLLGHFTEDELARESAMKNLKPLEGYSENQIAFGESVRRKFLYSTDGVDENLISKINENPEADHVDFWILLRHRASKNILPFAIGEKSIQVIADEKEEKRLKKKKSGARDRLGRLM